MPAGPPTSSVPALSPGRKWLFRLAAMLLVPLFALGAIELTLRLAGYGYSTRLFKPLTIGDEQWLVENDKFSLRFFPPELMRTPGPIRLKPSKPAGTYRIFILGESAAMGDPEPGFAASRYLQVLLRERFPETHFEVINVAFTAINSHVILPIARNCAEQDGDLWIIYMGNNEMVGPFGAATVFGPKAPPLALVRTSLALQQTRLGQLLSALADRLKSGSATPASWGGMQMFLGNQVPPHSSQRETVYRNFQKNLADILRVGTDAGARIILSTVAVNLKDCPPFSSSAETNLAPSDRAAFQQHFAAAQTFESQSHYAAAAERYTQAAKVHPQSAAAQFRWGYCLLQLTNPAAAADRFQAACDLDTLPFRTDSRINQAIHDAAPKPGNASVTLFDAAAWLATNSPQGIVGQETLYEHVHLNFDGNYLLALGWAEQVRLGLPEAWTRRAAAAWPTREICERQLGLTDWNRAIVIEGMIRRMQQPPLNAQYNNRRRMEALQARADELRRGMNPPSAAAARELYLEAIGRFPQDYCLRENFASFLVATGDVPGAAAQWEAVHQLIPQDYLANFRWGELLARMGKPEAQTMLQRAAELRPFLADPWCELGKIHITEGKLDLALEKFTRAQQLQPNNPEYHYQIGRALILLKRVDEGTERFRQALRYDPNYWQARDALGGQLGLAGNIQEAKAEFELVTRLQPSYARGHLNLGVALLKTGQAAEAALAFERAVRLDPTNTLAQEYLRQAQAAAEVQARPGERK